MSRDPLKMIMFPNTDPSPEEEEEETRWSIEYLQESLQNDSCYFRKVTDSSGCYAGFAIWTLDPSSTVTGHKIKSTQKRRESWNPASLDVRAWIEVSNLLREERQRVLNDQHNIWTVASHPFANLNIDALRREIRAGNLQGVQNTFSEWLEDNPSNISKIGRFYLCIGDAIECSQHEILTYLLSEGFPLDMFDISLATRRKERRALEIFIAHGWNINKPRTNRDPPLLSQAIKDEKLASWFLDHGADPNAECDFDFTPLSVAMVSASFATIKLLFDRGGSVKHGQLLHYVARRSGPDRIKLLDFILSKGAPGMNRLLHQHRPADYLSLGYAGLSTPLGMAAREGTLDIARYLLKRGADPTIKNSLGYLPIETAEYYNNHDIVTLLSEFGAASSNH
ncbi:hypothetical protein VE04_02095 [Pseudogymnoascus sp. 24MN13]|nr:hypothetical protein VE04_02095 [Pseudogymnoascus sp. 24MN13]